MAIPSTSRSRGFLDRIQSLDPTRPIDPSRSIQAHVLALLNARMLQSEGRSRSSSDGLMLQDIVHQAPLGLQALAKRIKARIGRFEPRIEKLNVRCEVTGTDPAISVQVCAWHRVPPQHPLRLHLTLRPDGRFSMP